MKILSIDTTSEVCGVALLDDDKLIDDNSITNGRTHSENLMPLISEILNKNNITLKNINLISCCVGPGSFTGIRIGVASVKALAEVNNIPIAEVTSLETLAQNTSICSTRVGLIDARNDQAYCGIFDNEINLKEDYIADNINAIIETLKKYDDVCISGNGVEKYKELLIKNIPNVKFADSNIQSAYCAGLIGCKKYLANNLKSADEIMPIYLRKSQAERMKNK